MTERSMASTLRGILTRLQSVERRLARVGVAAPADGELAAAGDVKLTARAAAPAGWLLADGSVLVRATYPTLFTAIGTAYNTGGETGLQFRLPNLKGRVPVGRDAAQTEFDVLGESGGSKTHLLSAAQSGVAEHYHGVRAMGNATPSGTGDGYARGSGTADASFRTQGVAAGSGYGSATGAQPAAQAHNNLQPYVVLNYVIKI